MFSSEHQAGPDGEQNHRQLRGPDLQGYRADRVTVLALGESKNVHVLGNLGSVVCTPALVPFYLSQHGGQGFGCVCLCLMLVLYAGAAGGGTLSVTVCGHTSVLCAGVFVSVG